MSQVFILQNQHKQFLDREFEWVDGRDTRILYKTPHRDAALNHMVEVNTKDYDQRIKILACNTNHLGFPIIDLDLLPPLTEFTASTDSLAVTHHQHAIDEYEDNGSLADERSIETATESGGG